MQAQKEVGVFAAAFVMDYGDRIKRAIVLRLMGIILEHNAKYISKYVNIVGFCMSLSKTQDDHFVVMIIETSKE